MKNGSDIQPEDSFLTLPVFLSSINQLKVPQWSSVWQWRGIYHSQIKARSSSTFPFTLGWEFMRTGGIVCAAYLVTQQSAKGCTIRQFIVFTLLISNPPEDVVQDTTQMVLRAVICKKCKRMCSKETTGVTVVCGSSLRHSTVKFIKFTSFREQQILNQFTVEKWSYCTASMSKR